MNIRCMNPGEAIPNADLTADTNSLILLTAAFFASFNLLIILSLIFSNVYCRILDEALAEL